MSTQTFTNVNEALLALQTSPKQKEAAEKYINWKKQLKLDQQMSCLLFEVYFQPDFEKAFQDKYPKAGAAKFSLLKQGNIQYGIILRVGVLDIHDSLLMMGIDPYTIKTRKQLLKAFTIKKALEVCNWEMYVGYKVDGKAVELSSQVKTYIFEYFKNGWMWIPKYKETFSNQFIYQKDDGTIVSQG